MSVIRAKFRCNSIIPVTRGSVVYMNAVYSNEPASENKKFTDATPSGTFQIHIDDTAPASGKFEVGADYYVDFTKAD